VRVREDRAELEVRTTKDRGLLGSEQEVSVKIDSLNVLFQEELKDIYDAEKRLVRALPKMAKAASSADLRQALEEHLEVTKGHVQRLEQVFELLGVPAKAKPCAGMKG
jgi:ferritin-like metal-binding protein YciE